MSIIPYNCSSCKLRILSRPIFRLRLWAAPSAWWPAGSVRWIRPGV